MRVKEGDSGWAEGVTTIHGTVLVRGDPLATRGAWVGWFNQG